MKIPRGTCSACGKRTVERRGEYADGRPRYRCQDGHCGHTYSLGWFGEDWDPVPSKHPAATGPNQGEA